MESTTSSVSTLDQDVLAWTDIEAYNTSVPVQNVHIAHVNSEICNRKFFLVQERSVHDLDRPWSEWIVD